MNGAGVPDRPLQSTISLPSAKAAPGTEVSKTKRARASKSCDHCRKRKIRCDVEISMPCSKCRASKKECRISQEPKRRGPVSQRYVQELEDRLIKMEALLAKYNTRISDSNEIEPHSAFAFGCPVKDSIESEELSQQLDALSLTDYERTKYIGNSAGIHLLDPDVFQHKRRLRFEESPTWIMEKLNDDEEEHIIIRSEERIESNQSTDYDRSTLFEIFPEMTVEFADYLIELYFFYIHPYNCAVNKVAFLEQYYYANPHPPDHFLLCAMVSAAIRTLPAEDFQLPIGTLIRKQEMSVLKHTLCEESMKVVGLAHKRSRISTLQALIVLTMFIEKNEDEEVATTHWFITGLAIRMAQDLGLHRNSSRWSLPKYEIELRRRIWYGVVIIDKWVAADLGRPPTISDDDFDVELPSLTELESPYNTVDDANTPPLLLQAREEAATQRKIYHVFRAHVALGKILDQVLRGFYSVKKQTSMPPDFALATRLETELHEWKNNLPPCLQYNYLYQNDILFSFVSILYISYNCVLLLIHRPFIVHKLKSKAAVASIASRSLEISTNASNQVIDCFEALTTTLRPGMILNTMIYSCLQASAVFVFNANNNNPCHREQGLQNLKRLANILGGQTKSARIQRFCRILDQLIAKLANPPKNSTTTNGNILESSIENIQTVSCPSGDATSTLDNFGIAQHLNMAQIDEHQVSNAFNLTTDISTFETAGLSSDVPLWHVPNAPSWDDWERFLQSNIECSPNYTNFR